MAQEYPQVSIIIPIYNGEKTLPALLDGVLKQTLSAIEVLLVNDGSTDNTLAICNQWARADRRIRVINKPNGGPASARNCGIEQSKGAYITFFDADDRVEPVMVERMLQFAREHRCDCVVCGISVEEDTSSCLTSAPKRVIEGNGQIRAYVAAAMRGILFYSPCNKLYRRDLLECHHLRMPADVDLGEDLLFNLDYLAHAQVLGVLPQGFYHYIQRPGEHLMNRYRADRLDIMSLWVGSLRLFAQPVLKEKRLGAIVNWVCIKWMYSYTVSLAAGGLRGRERRALIRALERYPKEGPYPWPWQVGWLSWALANVFLYGGPWLIDGISVLIALYKRRYRKMYLKAAAVREGL